MCALCTYPKVILLTFYQILTNHEANDVINEITKYIDPPTVFNDMN